jgi:ATP-grasp domain, R2K clade family 3
VDAPTWVIEGDVFADGDEQLITAVRSAGCRVVRWDDEWLSAGFPPIPGPVVFHGSLANADRLAATRVWEPGAFCATARFECSAWWPTAAAHGDLLAPAFVRSTVEELTTLGPPEEFGDRVFVRPDSPLKPFSGRVLERGQISLRSLDHGFYYDDVTLPVMVTPIVDVGDEWRFVVVDGRVVAGSGYAADGRTARLPLGDDHPAHAYAQSILAYLTAPEAAFVLDVAEGPDGLRLLELNPFSGADLYACDRSAVVDAVHRVLG